MRAQAKPPFARYLRSALLPLFLSGLSTTLLTSCDALTGPPKGRIEFRNDLSKMENTTVRVSGGGDSRTLESGDRFTLPAGTRSISVSYYDGKQTLNFAVRCPANPDRGVRINLIDLYQGRLDGGCEKL